MIRRAVAFDLGTVCGFAYWDHGVINSGVIDARENRFSGAGVRFLNFRERLSRMFDERRPDLVVYEAVNGHRGTHAAHTYGGFWGQLTSLCESRTIPYTSRTPQQIKRFIVGRAAASKDDVIAAVTARGFSPQDDNEADAIALLLFVESEYNLSKDDKS